MPVLSPPLYHAIIDVGMTWIKVKPGNSWSQYAFNLYKYILARHPEAVTFHLIIDIYNEDMLKDSPKQHEQKRQTK